MKNFFCILFHNSLPFLSRTLQFHHRWNSVYLNLNRTERKLKSMAGKVKQITIAKFVCVSASNVRNVCKGRIWNRSGILTNGKCKKTKCFTNKSGLYQKELLNDYTAILMFRGKTSFNWICTDITKTTWDKINMLHFLISPFKANKPTFF